MPLTPSDHHSLQTPSSSSSSSSSSLTSSPFSSISRSLLSLRREQVHAMDSSSESSESFLRLVTDELQSLLTSPTDALDVSLPWLHSLLSSFLSSLNSFNQLLFSSSNPLPIPLSKPPLDRLLSDLFDRSVKSLDVLNAVRDGLDLIRQWHNHLDIVLSALSTPNPRPISDAQLRRANKALAELALAMVSDKDSASILSHRNRSFGRHPASSHRPTGHIRSLSWSVSRSWSAARQLQSIANNLNPPRTAEIASTAGLAVPVYTMSSILLFVMWALVAAIPCQDRGIQLNFSVPRHFPWAAPILSLHDRIIEESKKRDRKNSNGLLREIHGIDKCARHLTELTDSMQCPLTEEQEAELRAAVKELSEVCGPLKDGINSLERRVKEVFRRIVSSRTMALDLLGKTNSTR